MRVVTAIIRRDLLRMVRNPVRTALMFALPLVLAGVFVLAFGGGGGDAGPTVRVLLWDEDDGLLGRLARGVDGGGAEAPGRLQVIPVGPDGRQRIAEGEASALVHLPPGFTRAVLEGRATRIEVWTNPAQRYLPRVVDEGVRLGAAGLETASRVFRPELELLTPLFDQEEAPSDALIAALSVGINQRMRTVGEVFLPPRIGLEVRTRGEDPAQDEAASSGGTAGAILAFILPGMAMFGVLFMAQTATRDILVDREAGLVRHLLTAPVSVRQVLIGKSGSVLVVSGVGLALLTAAGGLAGMDLGRLHVLLATVASAAVVASGLLLALYSAVRTQRQGDAVTTIAILLGAMLGGVFVPVQQMPGGLQSVAILSPITWATDALRQAVAGGSLVEVGPLLLRLVAAGGLLILVGAWALGRRIAAGGS